MQKRILRKNRYYIVKRNKKGQIVSFKRWRNKVNSLNVRAGIYERRNIPHRGFHKYSKKNKEGLKRRIRILDKAIEKNREKRTTNFNSKRFLLESPAPIRTRDNKLSRVRIFSRPVKSTIGFMEVDFEFYKNNDTITVSGRSKKGYFPKGYKKAFNECFRSALKQVHFSPDGWRILDVRYVYYRYEKI